ncbi:hypothetical protein [Aeromicrobium sp. 179-A 4D2 NHS]|uniref:hypothetical protein n=1 Tax=Aeromicrobium sp. 179-A 4D2 NHS TaxID=3142375 RepID=UPI0039A31C4F
MSAVRRRILTNPNESLLLCHSAFDLSARFGEFADMSGVPETAIVSNALSAVPIPDYREIEPGRRRWEGTRPEFMWHPLMWLPERLAYRYSITTTDGRTIGEITPVYTIRVISELSAAGLYDTETGTWLDVLSVVDLDITDPAVQERVAAWLDGNPDPILDEIDLSVMLVNDDPEWAYDLAVDLALPAVFASWAVVANDLSEVINIASAGDDEDIARALTTVYYCGLNELRSVPDGDEPNSAAFWAEFGRAIEDMPDDRLVDTFLPRVVSYLERVRDEYWKHYESLPSILIADPEQQGVAIDNPEPVAAPEPEPAPVVERPASPFPAAVPKVPEVADLDQVRPPSPFETAAAEVATPGVRPSSPFSTDDELTPPPVSEPVRPALPWEN